MKASKLARATARSCSAALVLMAAAQNSAGFGGVGPLGECTSFTTCTAALGSSTVAFSQYRFSDIGAGYVLPSTVNPAVGGVSLTDRLDTHVSLSTTPSAAAVGVFCVGCATDNPFFSSAGAKAQSGFAVNRAEAVSGFGADGVDDRGSDVHARVRVITFAQSQSAWRDAWTFSGDGRFSATVHLDGVSRNATTNAFFPSTYLHSGVGTSGDWYFDLRVWDVDNLSISEYFETAPGPTLVTRVQDRSGISDEQRPSFASSVALDFDFVGGVHYVVTAELSVQARNGRTIDLYNTARLQDVVLGSGAGMSALSGHDYLAPVPEPAVATLLATGLALGLGLTRRRRR